MAEGASRERWARTSTEVWIVAESKRNRKKRPKPFTPDDFSPWGNRSTGGHRSGGERLTVGRLLVMRGAFPQETVRATPCE